MSIDTVTARIAEIQGRIARLSLLGAPGVATTATSAASSGSSSRATTAADFAATLAAARTTTGTTGTSGNDGRVTGEDVVAEARKYLGLPYVWGGTDPSKGLDCSGLVQLVYKNLGYDLPRVSYQQAAEGRPVASLAEARPGDLIAWDNSSRNDGVDHIAIYIGNGKMIEAPRTGLDVRIIDVPTTPDVIRRILPDSTTGGASGVSALAARTAVDAIGLAGLDARVDGSVPYASLINAAAARTGVPGELIAAVARQESAFNPKAVSSAGAQGLMQLMPGTAAGLGVTNSFDPAQAIDGGARLLSTLLDRFGRVDLALAAYNAGPGAVLRYDGVPPYAETQNYVKSVMAMVRS
ncbi:lytic transglycosylase [Nocardioides sp. GY 10113]|uniref:transglycosylase SLT domain-containing protein n=1 Tax=Nocardioides sp. GY 10113 TaxID=2569761 RepID=UPI0010A7612E|nr:transglycosylase SLT domain-containing protein [Nocardioides sp. GY 10113]TIC83524.1 lytic transglycosylase [Nocardioides sp. GY 10113]